MKIAQSLAIAMILGVSALLLSCDEDSSGPTGGSAPLIKVGGSWVSVLLPTPYPLQNGDTARIVDDTTYCRLTLDTLDDSAMYSMVDRSGTVLFSSAGTWTRIRDSVVEVSPSGCMVGAQPTPAEQDSLCTRHLVFTATDADTLTITVASMLHLSTFLGIDIAPILADPQIGPLIPYLPPMPYVRVQ